MISKINENYSKKEHIKHHIVPVCYLKNFSSDGKIVWVYNKNLSKSYPKNVNDVLYRSNFYRIDDSIIPKNTDKVNPLSFEVDYFAKDVESQYSNFLRIFIPFIEKWLKDEEYRNNIPILPDCYVEHIAFQIVVQLFRSPEARTHSSELVKSAKKMLKLFSDSGLLNRNYLSTDIDKTINTDLGPVIDQMMVCFNPVLIKDWVKILQNKIWIIYVAKEGHFVTSDTPVIYERKMKIALDFWAINDEGTIISYPITKNVYVQLLDRESYSKFSHLDRRINIVNKTYVDMENSRMYAWAEEIIASSEEEAQIFRLVKDTIGKDFYCRH